METIIQTLSAIAPFVLAVLTFFYLLETRKMRKETEKSRKEQTKPFVVFDVLPQQDVPQLLDVVIKNYGSGPAINVSFGFTPEVPYYASLDNGKSTKLSDLPLLKKISYLPPGEERRLFFESFINYENQGKLMEFQVNVIYEDIFKRKFKETFDIDLKRWHKLMYIHKESVSKKLENIRAEIEKIHKKLH